jgi:hypothetical protein
VRSNAPSSFTTVVRRDGAVVVSQPSTPELSITQPSGPGVYRVEIRASDRPGAPLWVLSNPIFVRAPASAEIQTRPARGAPVASSGPTGARPVPLILFGNRDSAEWHTEVAPASKAATDIVTAAAGRELLVRYALPGGDAAGQFAAAVVDTTGTMSGRSRLKFTVRAGQPMRLSIQVRVPTTASGGERWQRSIYVDETVTTHLLDFAEFTLPLGATRAAGLDVAAVHGVLFTVDRMNTAPGSSGRFWLRDVMVE